MHRIYCLIHGETGYERCHDLASDVSYCMWQVSVCTDDVVVVEPESMFCFYCVCYAGNLCAVVRLNSQPHYVHDGCNRPFTPVCVDSPAYVAFYLATFFHLASEVSRGDLSGF